jgi:hypothetical protein
VKFSRRDRSSAAFAAQKRHGIAVFPEGRKQATHPYFCAAEHDHVRLMRSSRDTVGR